VHCNLALRWGSWLLAISTMFSGRAMTDLILLSQEFPQLLTDGTRFVLSSHVWFSRGERLYVAAA
jgi:hypothetical protein